MNDVHEHVLLDLLDQINQFGRDDHLAQNVLKVQKTLSQIIFKRERVVIFYSKPRISTG